MITGLLERGGAPGFQSVRIRFTENAEATDSDNKVHERRKKHERFARVVRVFRAVRGPFTFVKL